jgi:hypothetical protein
MKLSNTLRTAALLLASAGLASSQTVIRIVGSNGDRTATQNAIAHILGSNGNTWTFRGVGGYISGQTGSTGSVSSIPTGSNYGSWSGTYNGQAVVIKVSFLGALAGISAVAGNTDQRFVVTNGTDGTTAVTDPTLSTAVLGTDYELGKADFGLSTNFQSTSPYNGVYNGVTYNPVDEEIVGVSPLGFYASPGFPSGLNITTQLAQQLYTTGAVPLSLFTGNFTNGDQNKIVYAIGRNTDAGQRFGAYTEIGLGTTSVVKVWKSTYSTAPTGSPARNGVVGSHALWPAETINGIYSPLGSGGLTTGANVAEILTATLSLDAAKGKYTDDSGDHYLYPNATAGYYVGYVTPSDASTRILPYGGVALKFNGVDLTTANVQNGLYTAWLYNRLLRPQSGLVGLKATFATQLATQIKTVDATNGGGIIESTLNVVRTADGGPVTPR